MTGVVDPTWPRTNTDHLKLLIQRNLTQTQVARDVLPLLGELDEGVVQAVHEKYPAKEN